MASDPTSAKLGESALQQLEQLQARINQLGTIAQDDAVGGLVAHEVRNLLTPAVAYVQIALARPDDVNATHKALDRSLTAMRRACEVAELILACVKEPAASDLPATPLTVSPPATSDVAQIINDCLDSLGWESKDRRFDLKVDAAKNRIAAITPDALRHVLLNLLLNARAALPERGGQITIRVSELASQTTTTWNKATPARTLIVIEVKDNGRGIEPSRLQRIRSGLRTGRESLEQNPGSRPPVLALNGIRAAGLGLLLCDQLLSSSGGQLRIESSSNRGTAASVRIPAAKAA